jgi:hypothetical protein
MNGAREDAHAGSHSAVHGAPGGLAVSASGYTLQVSSKTFEAGREETFGMRILDSGGHVVRDFDEQHGESMHLMVVRRDLIHYQHLHPSLGTDGAWSVPLVLPEPGVYRAFADFSVGGVVADTRCGPARTGRNGTGVVSRSHGSGPRRRLRG